MTKSKPRKPPMDKKDRARRDIYFDKNSLIDEIQGLADAMAKKLGRPVSFSEVVRMCCESGTKAGLAKLVEGGAIVFADFEPHGIHVARLPRSLNIRYETLREGERVKVEVAFYRCRGKTEKVTRALIVERIGDDIRVVDHKKRAS